MEQMLEKMYRQTYPTYFPAIVSQQISDWISDVERLFKQPVKNVFPYPMDVKKVIDKETGRLKKLSFQIALAGIEKENIKVQLKNKKYLTISVQKPDEEAASENDVEEYEYVNKGISYRDSEISFRIFQDIDLDKFKPSYKDGLLTIDLYVKYPEKDADVIDATIE